MTRSNRMKFRLEILKLSCNISLSNEGLKSPFYSQQAIWSLEWIRERFNDSLKIQNLQAWLGGKSFYQELLFSASKFRRLLQPLLLRYMAEILQVI